MDPILLITLTIDVVGIVVGSAAVFVLLSTKSRIGGEVGGALGLFVWGLSFMILAFLYTVVFTRLKLYPAPSVDIHHALMTISMVIFIVSAMKFSDTAS